MNNWMPISTFVNFTTKGITPSYVERSSIIVLNQKCIRNNRIDYSFAQFTDDSKNIPESKFVREGDILVNSTGTGTAGRCAFVSQIPKEHRLIVDSHILILRCDSFITAQCLSYSLFSFEKTLMSFMTGSSGQSELDKVVLLNLKTKIPSDLSTQQQIASVLSALDAKIELNMRINAELEAMAKTLYDYWFVQFEFPASTSSAGSETEGSATNTSASSATNPVPELVEGKPYKTSGGKMVWNEQLKRNIPEGWVVYSLFQLLDCNKWTIKKENNFSFINYLDTSNLTKNTISEIQRIDCKHESLPSRAQRLVEKNDILYSTVRPNQCHFGIIKEPLDNMVASTGFAQLRSKNEGVSNDLIYQFLSQESTILRLQRLADSAVSSYPSILPNDILDLKIALPKRLNQLGFSKIFESANYKVSKNLQENHHLASLRDWLLPMLMNGQVTVRQAHGNAVAEAEKMIYQEEEMVEVAAETRENYKAKNRNS